MNALPRSDSVAVTFTERVRTESIERARRVSVEDVPAAARGGPEPEPPPLFRAMSKATVVFSLCLATAFASCEAVEPFLAAPPEELDLWADAAAGVSDPRLAKLCADLWNSELRRHPFQATYLGDPRFHGDVPDESLEGRVQRRHELQAFQERLRRITLDPLFGPDPLTGALLRTYLETELARIELGLEEWNVDPIEGPHTKLLNLAGVQPHATERQREQLVSRWEKLGVFLRTTTRNLERGRREGRVASRTAVEKSIKQLDALLAQPPHLSPLVAVASEGGQWVPLPAGGNLAAIAHEQMGDAREQGVLRQLNRHLADAARIAQGTYVLLPIAGDGLSLEERSQFVADVLDAVEQEIYPALSAYRAELAEKILPAARDDEHPGLAYVPNGKALYATLIH